MKLSKILVVPAVIAIFLFCLSAHCPASDKDGVFIVPESERPLDFVVIGIWSNSHSYIFSPELKWEAGAGRDKKELEKELYWLNLEFTHGEVFEKLPAYTKIYVLVPDKKYVKDATGDEKDFFIEYLKKRCSFTDAEIKIRVQFFYTTNMVVWPQDMCKVIGYNKADGRVVIARSTGDASIYVKTVKEFTDAYPDKFVMKDIGETTSAEGGDEDIIQLPGRRVALMTGRHRVQRYIERVKGYSFDRAPIDDTFRENARQAFSNAYAGAPVVFLPEKFLKNPEKGSEEVFHLDMLAGIMPDPKGGKPKEFIPSVMKNCYVSLNDEQLNDEFVDHMQAEYDAAAQQMQQLGFETPRLKYCDHPVRGPANFIKFHDKITGSYSVMLGKYPNHLPVDDPYTPQHRIISVFKTVKSKYDNWVKKQDKQSYEQLQEVISLAWSEMDKVSEEANPVYEEQKKQFEKYGYHVITVPVYAWGAGGNHCLVMY